MFLIPELLLALDQEDSWPESLSWATEVLTALTVDRQGHKQPPRRWGNTVMLNGKQGLRIFILLAPQVTLSIGVQKQLHHNMARATEKLRAAGPPGEVMLLGDGLKRSP